MEERRDIQRRLGTRVCIIKTYNQYRKRMMKMNRWFATAAAVMTLCLAASSVSAQSNNNNNSGGSNRRGNRGNFDPAQFQQLMMDRLKDQLEITDDAEWKAIEPMIQKVMDLRRELMSSAGRGMFGRRSGGDSNSGDSNRSRGGGFFGPPSAETEALQKAVDGKASNAEMKAAIAKYQEARKAKQAELEKAQAALRGVLSVRQEAVATLDGLL